MYCSYPYDSVQNVQKYRIRGGLFLSSFHRPFCFTITHILFFHSNQHENSNSNTSTCLGEKKFKILIKYLIFFYFILDKAVPANRECGLHDIPAKWKGQFWIVYLFKPELCRIWIINIRNYVFVGRSKIGK